MSGKRYGPWLAYRPERLPQARAKRASPQSSPSLLSSPKPLRDKQLAGAAACLAFGKRLGIKAIVEAVPLTTAYSLWSNFRAPPTPRTVCAAVALALRERARGMP